ncbi:MAG: class I SAM-dependent methyltransferase [Candidatus Hydrogenedentes bacterium]|nr:class I SAM-dependent methyltransferase [Candidatus Hydrogenedentota bacterium]
MDPRDRFSNRADDYDRYRPGYPRALVSLIAERCGLRPGHSVADIGSGTGILTDLILEHGNRVYAVEPNGPMREAAERRLGGRPGFFSVDGTAEATTLLASSVDLVVAAQAFHWFEPRATRDELRRILRAPGWVALIWNERPRQATGFEAAYEALLERHAIDYAAVDHRRVDAARVDEFFHPARAERIVLSNSQSLDRAGLAGRVRSCSYVPAAGAPGYGAMMGDAGALFDERQVGGVVVLNYETIIYLGALRPGPGRGAPPRA